MSSQVAKALSSVDGQAYVLRRIDGRQASFQGWRAAGWIWLAACREGCLQPKLRSCLQCCQGPPEIQLHWAFPSPYLQF